MSYFKSLSTMTSDLSKNFRRIATLALFEYKLSTKDLFLGSIWRFLNPVIQIGVYWLVFGIGLRSGAPIDGVPYVVWLTCGVAPWQIMNSAVMRTAGSIRAKATLLTRSNIPTSLIPVSTTLAEIFNSTWTILLVLIVFFANQCTLTWTSLGLIYYVVCMFAFLAVFGLITSVLVLFAKDFSNLLHAFLRLWFFISPVFWKPGQSLPEGFHKINFFNPFGYVIDGFRDSLLFHVPFWNDSQRMLFFWGFIIILYLLGAACQSKLRKNLLDYL